MKREIKFRAWDKEQNNMWGWDKLIDKQGTYLNSKYFAVMQYIGLHDKNRKEIYEGDIVKYNFDMQSKFVVKWCKRKAGFEYLEIKKKKRFLSNKQKTKRSEYGISQHPGSYEVEIIGNIYQDKKLLQNK